MEPFQILTHAKKFLLRAVPQVSPASLSSGQLRQVSSRRIHCSATTRLYGGSHLRWSLLSSSLLPVWSLSLSLFPLVGFPAPAGVPVCRSGPGGGGSSLSAPRPPQPQPGNGLPLNGLYVKAEKLNCTDRCHGSFLYCWCVICSHSCCNMFSF